MKKIALHFEVIHYSPIQDSDTGDPLRTTAFALRCFRCLRDDFQAKRGLSRSSIKMAKLHFTWHCLDTTT